MATPDADPAASALDGIRKRLDGLDAIRLRRHSMAEESANLKLHAVTEDFRHLLAAVEAALDQADDLTRKSEALDAEAEYIAGEHPEAAAVAVLKRERSIAYDECARRFREAITAALAGKGEGNAP